MANLIKFQREISPWNDFFNVDDFFDRNRLKRQTNYPAVNVSENDKNYSIEIVAPGFKREDFKLKVDSDMLTISAETKTEKKDQQNGKEYTRREYSYNSFTRTFHLPDNVSDDNISASYHDGILELTLPKSETQTKSSKEIPIS
jgi:HSP20 family protein